MKGFINKNPFMDVIRYCSQCIKQIFTKTSLIHTKQTPRFLFRFLRINLGRGTLYHDLYHDIKISANSPRLMAEPRIIQPIKGGSFGLERFKRSRLSQLLHGGYLDWTVYFYIASGFLFEPIL